MEINNCNNNNNNNSEESRTQQEESPSSKIINSSPEASPDRQTNQMDIELNGSKNDNQQFCLRWNNHQVCKKDHKGSIGTICQPQYNHFIILHFTLSLHSASNCILDPNFFSSTHSMPFYRLTLKKKNFLEIKNSRHSQTDRREYDLTFFQK
jgi:hypothetical protein